MSPKRPMAAAAVAGMLCGCVTPVPPQLREARLVYKSSGDGTTAMLSPTQLYGARQVLDSANREFDENGDTFRARDYAYIASRRVELAEVTARTDQDRQTILEAVRAGVIMCGPNAEAAATEVEWPTRLEVESKLATALNQLSAIAPVREEARGLVVALDGRDLFVPGTYVLMPEAKKTLEHVAAALISQSDDQPILVEGHTNSPSYEAVNQSLSLNRANAVRDYLVASGVQSERISALGLTLSSSTSRWVEIVVLAPAVSER
jgi:outer membrane protein OmpA-like peptidoglycan-associated protein